MGRSGGFCPKDILVCGYPQQRIFYSMTRQFGLVNLNRVRKLTKKTEV